MSLDIYSIFTDKQSDISGFVYGVVNTPKKKRKRFPDGIVRVCESENEAQQLADPSQHIYAAKLAGPARSSEGFMLYYLVEWL